MLGGTRMKRNYNGDVNRTVIRALKRLCNVNAENEKNLIEAFNQKGQGSVYENLEPFIGWPDEMSDVITMKSETEIKEYMREDVLKRVELYLDDIRPSEDYLLNSLIDFIKENRRFPEKDVMRQLEKNAEEKRIAKLPSDTVTVPKEITERDMAKEILELAEEIMELRRENNPDDIVVRLEPYPEAYWIETEEFQGNILHERYYGNNDFHDYSCAIKIKGWHHDVETISIGYCYGCGDPAYVIARNFLDKEIDVPVTDYLITIHKSIVEMAKAAGVDFVSEIDYGQFQAA